MAKKMILIDPRLLMNTQSKYAPPDTLNDSLRDLDYQMQQVLEQDELAPHDKAKLYQQTLQRYLTRLNQYRSKPLGLVDIKPTPPPPVSQPQPSPLPVAATSPKPDHSILKVEDDDILTETKTPEKSVETPSPSTLLSSPSPSPTASVYSLRRGKRKSKVPVPRWEKWSTK